MNQKHEEEQEGPGLRPFLRLLDEAVRQVVHHEDPEAFLAWMRQLAPALFPEVFTAVPEPGRSSLATELGRQIWNAIPLPGNGYEPRPLRRPGEAEPCPCGSGRTYGRCCAGAPAVPGLGPELVWALVLSAVPLKEAAELAEAGRIPRAYLGIVGRRLMAEGKPGRALDLLEPLFEEPQLLRLEDMDTLDALLGAYETLGRRWDVRSFVEHFAVSFLRRETDRERSGEPDSGG